VPGQTEVLWRATTRRGKEIDPNVDFMGKKRSRSSLDGWNYDTAYRFQITHIPETGLIRLNLYEGATLLHNAEVYDTAADRLMGGRLGVYCDSQEAISWSALSYRCLA